jgi:polyvinyl alcohol dehydrogenase (cytochrome)
VIDRGERLPGRGTCKSANGPDFDFGASPILVKLGTGKRCLLLGQKSAMVYAIDPTIRGSTVVQHAGIERRTPLLSWK